MAQEEKKLRWMRLDNAAKIYPAARRRNWSNVFRISVTLCEEVDRQVLQAALQVTVKRFPSIAVRLRRGGFWYYLEEIGQAPQICDEKPWPAARMTDAEIRRCAFRVLCYHNRIAVEFFHALTDGNGGLIFVKTLTAEYLQQKYGVHAPAVSGVLDRTQPPLPEELEDSFLIYEGPVGMGRREPDAYRLTGEKEPDRFIDLTTGTLEVSQVLAAAKRYNTSLTTFLTAVMMQSILTLQAKRVHHRSLRRPVKVLIPVNLRKMFGSSTLRNFVLYIIPSVDPRLGDYSFEELIKIVHHQMGMELTDKQMARRITANVQVEKSPILKVMPLFIKNFAMKLVYNMVGEKKSCITISNLGAVHLPQEMQPYVQRMDFILGIQAQCAYNCSALSYGDKLYISFIRNIVQPDLERDFFTTLRQMGLWVRVESNRRTPPENYSLV